MFGSRKVQIPIASLRSQAIRELRKRIRQDKSLLRQAKRVRTREDLNSFYDRAVQKLEK
jgi:hypothetical protein